jgi:3-hydroxyisobutyrate dehydrogenase-like beta-hydroxyacid dehydrogenase
VTEIGFLHPGRMGVSLAASAQNSGCTAYWVPAGRSAQTRQRAEQHKLVGVGSLAELCRRCAVIVSICPPEAAEEVAAQVAACDYTGLYLDANAISPEKVGRIGRLLESTDATFVDGSVIGGPAWQPGLTCLYLSGREAERVAAYFAAGPLTVQVMSERVGQASALKMCYAAYSKGTTALLYAALAAAEGLGVRAQLEAQWERDGAGLAGRARAGAGGTAAKAWRFQGEMVEIAATLQAAGLPPAFHTAAAELYGRLAHLKEHAGDVMLEEVLGVLAQSSDAAE